MRAHSPGDVLEQADHHGRAEQGVHAMGDEREGKRGLDLCLLAPEREEGRGGGKGRDEGVERNESLRGRGGTWWKP